MLMKPALDALTYGWRIAKQDGIVKAVERGLATVRELRGCRHFLEEIDRMPSSASVLQVVDLVFSHPSVRPWQVKSEILELNEIVECQRPRTVLEIGTAKGGTLFLFCHFAAPDASIISVDLPLGRFGGGYPVWREGVYNRFAKADQRLHLIRDDSHLPGTFDQVRRMLNGRPIDLLFIDGDHTYEGVKTDFWRYSPLVASGGCVALHDIVRSPSSSACQVATFWDEIQGRFRTKEIVERADQGGYGIGLVWM
jgi:cephalosporin hydroxylase